MQPEHALKATAGQETGCNASSLSFSFTGPCVSTVGGGGASPIRFSYSQTTSTATGTALAAVLAAVFFAAVFLAAFFGAASATSFFGKLFGQIRYTPDLSVFSSR